MRNSFYGLEIAKKALQSQQVAMHITGHNIANANTVGYTRQVPQFTQQTTSTIGLFLPLHLKNLGSGVLVEEVKRIRDQYLDLQIRQESRAGAYWRAVDQGLEQIEIIFGEPGESALSSIFDTFWNTWQELATSPESSAARALVVENGDLLAKALNDTYARLERQQGQLNEEISIKVQEVNNMLQQIYDLNHQIARLGIGGGNVSDYKDQLDVLVDDLSKILSLQVKENDNGSYTLVLQGQVLVSDNEKNSLFVQPDPSTGFFTVHLSTSGEALKLSYQNGELKALFDLRDHSIEEYKGYLDQLANDLADAVNTLHRTGYTLEEPPQRGTDFFVGSGAASIAVNSVIEANINLLAASSTGAPGDGGVALAIAQLREEKIISGGSATPDDYYRGFISRLGAQREEVSRLVSNQEVLVEQLEMRKESISGVSLDEEMTNLIKYQYAYQAASFLVNTINNMLEALLNIAQ